MTTIRQALPGDAPLDAAAARTNTTAQALYESKGWVRDESFYEYSLEL